ncbi:hypothetical protein PHYSODRAFT_343606 [Phytophthora sojae]|uniref:Uncharacterized protein n=1 Tax=Phytophthora sojae (strain P6497) TaxID=1094619 RepID=G4YIA3_PHYSP|nr:hypothetical protein PHYSODRAFT_343606 [Phytophthora sojae]EGZ27486.1 hypothetical protein PHYSODRAFT_343606 [Phytophthora sojae]|eukprot:XP_009514761.1 hypothetical protein PHYSODRAFT_343606 [Phytophthora sojae]
MSRLRCAFSAEEIEEIKELIIGLLDDSLGTDQRTIKTAFWERVRCVLSVNPQSQRLEHLQAVVDAVLEEQEDLILGGPIFVLPPLPSAPPSTAASRSPSPPPKSGKGKGKAPRRSNKRAASPSPASTPSSKKARAETDDEVQPIDIDEILRVSQAAPKPVRDAIAAVLAKCVAEDKMPWRIAYPWCDRSLWYDPVKYPQVYREHWRFYMLFRALFWHWAFNATLMIKKDTDNRRKSKLRAGIARLRLTTLCIETWGYFGFTGCSRATTTCTDLTSLYRTDSERFEFVIDNALNPALIDGYHSLLHLLESTRALDPKAPAEHRLSLDALARIRMDIKSDAPRNADWVGDEDVGPWHALIDSKIVQETEAILAPAIKDGSYKPTSITTFSPSDIKTDDFSDFEDDEGKPTALAPAADDE